MSSSDSLPDSPKAPDEPVFAGITFHIHGQVSPLDSSASSHAARRSTGAACRAFFVDGADTSLPPTAVGGLDRGQDHALDRAEWRQSQQKPREPKHLAHHPLGAPVVRDAFVMFCVSASGQNELVRLLFLGGCQVASRYRGRRPDHQVHDQGQRGEPHRGRRRLQCRSLLGGSSSLSSES